MPMLAVLILPMIVTFYQKTRSCATISMVISHKDDRYLSLHKSHKNVFSNLINAMWTQAGLWAQKFMPSSTRVYFMREYKLHTLASSD